MKSSELAFRASDGRELCVYRWWPDPDIALRAIVHIAHGMGEHAARYAPAAARLCASGYAALASDLRGHGRTARDPRELGHLGDVDGWNRVVLDLHELNTYARGQAIGTPLLLLGHSMGSFLAQQILLERPETLDGVILSGSSAPAAGALSRVALWLARLETWRLGKAGHSALLQLLVFGRMNQRFEPARTPYDWLSRDPGQVDAYIADPLCGSVLSAQSLCDLFRALGSLTDPTRLARIPKDMPLYVFSGSEDPVHDELAGLQRLCAAYRGAGLTRLLERIYPGGRHEMFNETNADQVCKDLVEWLDGIATDRRRT